MGVYDEVRIPSGYSWQRGSQDYAHPVNVGGPNPNPLPRPIAMIAAESDLTEEDFPAPIPVELL